MRRIPTPLRNVDLGRETARDGAGDLVLQVEQIFDFEAETVRPEHALGCRVDQLDRDAKALAGASQAARQDILHAQALLDLLRRIVLRLNRKAECRAITIKLRNRVRLAMMSSAIPSQRWSLRGSPDRFVRASTAMVGCCAASGLGAGRRGRAGAMGDAFVFSTTKTSMAQ